ncbi:Uncharacterised protein [Klebsiella pneumoniae]|nr:Uncharacterised protein [Klebsiella pneumoniae]
MKIELSDQQLQVIDRALQQLPYNVAAPIIEHINKQKKIESGRVQVTGNRSPSLPSGYAYLNHPVTNPERKVIGYIGDSNTMLC